MHTYLWSLMMDKDTELLRVVYPALLLCLRLLAEPVNANANANATHSRPPAVSEQQHQLLEHLAHVLLRRGTTQVRQVRRCAGRLGERWRRPY